jgi:hypothetical protein
VSEDEEGWFVLAPIDPGKAMEARLRHFSQPEADEAVEREKDHGEKKEEAHGTRHESHDSFGGDVGHQNWK